MQIISLNCPVCKFGIEIAERGWEVVKCPNCKVNIPFSKWIARSWFEDYVKNMNEEFIGRIPSAEQEETIPFNEEDVKAYLDRCIFYWRNKRESGDVTAEQYIDAFQSVRMSLFGELLARKGELQ